MIEEIKKEIEDNVQSINMMPDDLGENYYISKDEVFEILDKYNNQYEDLKKTNETNSELANLYLKYEPIITKAKYEVNSLLNGDAEVSTFDHKNVDENTKEMLILLTEIIFINERLQELSKKYNLDNKPVSIVERVDE